MGDGAVRWINDNIDMRLLEFNADHNTVAVRTYSPVLDRYNREPDQEFTLRMDKNTPC